MVKVPWARVPSPAGLLPSAGAVILPLVSADPKKLFETTYRPSPEKTPTRYKWVASTLTGVSRVMSFHVLAVGAAPSVLLASRVPPDVFGSAAVTCQTAPVQVPPLLSVHQNR